MQARSVLYKVMSLNLLAIIATVAISSPFGKTYRQFEDGGFITYFSVIQLFILSRFTYKIFKTRSQAVKFPWRSIVAIWGIFSLGFSFLALDDLLMIHEFFDASIHDIWRLQETNLSDRLDDAIICLYGLLALGACVAYRQELKKYAVALPLAITAFALLFIMIGIDALTNRDDVLLTLFSPERVVDIQSWIFILEDGCKLLSEAFFIVAVHRCLQIARQLTPIPQDNGSRALSETWNRNSQYK